MQFFKNEHDKGKKGDYNMTDGDYYNDMDEIATYDGKTNLSDE